MEMQAIIIPLEVLLPCLPYCLPCLPPFDLYQQYGIALSVCASKGMSHVWPI